MVSTVENGSDVRPAAIPFMWVVSPAEIAQRRRRDRHHENGVSQASRKSSVVVVGVAAGLIVLGLIWFVLFPMQGSESTTSESNATTEGP